MSARKLFYVAPLLALLTTGSTVWAYTCYFDQNTAPVGYKPVGTSCIDSPSGKVMFTTSSYSSGGYQQIQVNHGADAPSNTTGLPTSLRFTAFGFDANGAQVCNMGPPARTVTPGSPLTASCFYNGQPTSASYHPVTYMNVYHYN